MKKQFLKSLKRISILTIAVISLASCSIVNHRLKEADSYIRFVHENFEYSDQVTGEAQTTRVLGIDWQRLFNMGEHATAEGRFTPVVDVASLPIIGNVIKEKTSNLALYDMLSKNAGYDMIIYPQYEISMKGIPFLYSKTSVTATARLGKLKK